MDIDLGFIFKKPKYDITALLTINPLAPLSMVNSMPGAYYKTEYGPTKFMLCGLFENILGFHVSHKDRQVIRRHLKRHFEEKLNIKFPEEKSPVGYLPLVHHLFQIKPPLVLPHPVLFEDLWTQHLIGDDERHMNGATNYDWELESRINQVDNSREARNIFFKKHKKKFPYYYRSPQRREFLIANGIFMIKLILTRGLFEILTGTISINNIGYLGTSEGWVDLTLKEL